MSKEEVDPPINDTESEEELSNDPVQEESSSEEESDDEVTPEEQATLSVTNQSLPDVTEQLDGLHLSMTDRQRQPAPTASVAGGGTADRGSVKVNSPTEFNGRRDQLKAFKI